MHNTLEIKRRSGVAEIRFGSNNKKNLLNGETIDELTKLFTHYRHDKSINALVLSANGPTFSLGIDLEWMQDCAVAPFEENLDKALKLTGLFQGLYEFPKPTIVSIQGDARGAGIGLIAASDIAVCDKNAQFSIQEVRTGIIPAALSPYFIESVGIKRARDYFFTCREFSANEALSIGLVNYLCPLSELNSTVDSVLDQLLMANPASLIATKELLRTISHHPINDQLSIETTFRIAGFRTTTTARQGINAALNGTIPHWQSDT